MKASVKQRHKFKGVVRREMITTEEKSINKSLNQKRTMDK